MQSDQRPIAAIEAGGTKFICAVFNNAGAAVRDARIETRAPDETFRDVAAFYEAAKRDFGPFAAAGVASFGPIDLDPSSSAYGVITTTPKTLWRGCDIRGGVSDIVGADARIDTDVNCAAIAEGEAGAAIGLQHFCYMTVGTGIGVGVVAGGQVLSGVSHPEIGHMRVPRAPGDEDFAGICPSHGDCVEGLASGPAMQARWGVPASELPDDHPAWAMEADYIAALCVNLTYTLRPQRIIIGGGVFQRTALYGMVRAAFKAKTAGYALSAIENDVDAFIAAPGLVDQPPGLIGAYALARDGLALQSAK